MGIHKEKIAFLINPVSGTRSTKKQSAELEKYLNETHPGDIFHPQNADEMREAVHHLAEKNYSAIVACGGDGTLNLVSEQLTGTETAMAVIPLGSGNGFARHHHIPLRWERAMKIVDQHTEKICDTGIINGIHFINVAGIGFAAKISHLFKGVSHRGLSGYARTVIKNLKMEPFQASVRNEYADWTGETWMVEFCNGSQWGNNFRVAPGALDNDGALNAVIFKKMNPVHVPALGFRFATNSVPGSSNIISYTGASFFMEFEGRKPLHVDGEAIGFAENEATVSVIPKSLKLWTV